MSFGRCVLDFETRSLADLSAVGTWNYSLDPSTEVICACWMIIHNDGRRETGEWDMTMDPDMPGSLKWAILSGYECEAHNYSFELAIWENVCRPRMGWCEVKPQQWRDTMSVACYMAMPAKLDSLCRALRMGSKDPEGKRLITKYSCLYNKTAKKDIPAEDLAKFVAYCRSDVELEAAVSDYLGDLPDRELPIFQLDQRINLRGLFLDREGIEAAAAIVDQRAEELTLRFRELTGGLNPTQRDKCIAWFAEQGLVLDSMKADYLEELLEEAEIPAGPAREALRIRLQINKASTKKLDAMARQCAPDGRARWQSRYHGAQTGRWTGSGFQPLNLVRSWEDVEPEQLVRDVMRRDAGWLDMLYGDAMEAVSKAGRHWIMAPEGRRILAGDFVSIEAVILACLAGEEWKVEAFRQGKFIYGLMGCKIHGLDPELANNKKWFKEHYPEAAKDGKTGELAWGYQGALNAWLAFDNSGRLPDEKIIEFCKAWRAEHPMIVKFWRGLEDAAIRAVSGDVINAEGESVWHLPMDLVARELAHGGRTTHRTQYRDIGFEIVDEWLSMILPNGKRIWYREPELKTGMPKWHKPEVNEDCREGKCRCKPQAHLTYMAQKEGQWKRVTTYGGKLCENATQATAREFLIPSIVAAEAAGYPVILTVYDEIVAEVPNGHGGLEHFCKVLKDASGRDWAAGWPIGVDGWEGQRYRK